MQSAGNGDAVAWDFNQPGNYYFSYVISDAVCGFRADTMKVTVAGNAIGGYAYGDSTICAGDSIYITLANYSGNILGWQYSNDNFATWNFTNNNAPTALFAPMQDMQYRAVVLGFCGDTAYSNIGEVLVNNCNNNCANASYPAFAYDMGGRCPGDTVSLFGYDPARGNQFFQFLSGPATAVNTGNPNPNAQTTYYMYSRIFTLGNVPGDYYFVYVAQDSLCGTYTDTLKVTVNNCGNNCANFYADAGPDLTFCTGAPINLQGNFVSGAWMEWKFLNGPTPLNQINDGQGGAEVHGGGPISPGTYTYVYEVDDAVCGLAADTMQFVVADTALGGYAYGDTTVCAGRQRDILL